MRIRLQGPGHAASLLAELNRCRHSRQYCDVLLQVGNRTFAAHRAMLACTSSYFRSMLAQAAASPTFSLDFISPANFEKVLTFIYTGEILIDLIDVGVLYELAERLGIDGLVRACHTTFPDLQTSVSANCKASGDLPLVSSMASAAAFSMAAVSAASASCSSAASCSSLSSSAAPTPGLARADHGAHTGAPSLAVKAEDVQSHVGYGQMAVDHPPPRALDFLPSSPCSQGDGVLELKRERGLEDAGSSYEEADRDRGVVSGSGGGDTAAADSCSFPDSSAQLVADTCDPTSSSGERLGGLQVGSVEGGVVEAQRDGSLAFEEVEEREALPGHLAVGGTEEEQWRQLADDIIELSDEENFMEEVDEEIDEDDLVCVENGVGGPSSNQVTVVVHQ